MPLWLSSQLATDLSPLAPRSGLERSDFVRWPLAANDGHLVAVEHWGNAGSTGSQISSYGNGWGDIVQASLIFTLTFSY